ncbi:MAG: hypothetical protein ACK5MI_04665 [Mangrovibacterium sp.]
MKNAKKIFGLLVMTAIAFSSCSDDNNGDNSGDKSVTDLLDEGTMNGKLTEDYTLDGSSYRLTGSFIVEAGATLTIPAGTQIVANAGGTDVYIAVMMGAKINIKGTEENPVVMASTSATPGDWGGLTICGKATTTNGENAEAEVGGFIYGGTDDADNSGDIQYLIIKGTGAAINPESEYNGISFYAVGSATTINNIAVFNGSDDGVEFFGGTANASNVYLSNLDDDACDWAEGWNGKITNLYISNTAEGFSTAFEGDGVNNMPAFENVTCVATVDGTCFQFKKESGAAIKNLYLDGYTNQLDFVNDGATTNVTLDGAAIDVTNTSSTYYSFNSGLATTPTVDAASFDWATK